MAYTNTPVLSKIQIGGVNYWLKDAEVRQLLDALTGKIGTVPENSTVMDIIQNIQENAYDDTALKGLISGLQESKADKTQVASDIEAAVKAEADIARAAEKANADEIARVDAALKLAVENNEEGIDSIKELATWVNTHGAAAEGMSTAISKNAEDIVALQGEDTAIKGRLDVVEAALGEGEGSVSDQIADALQAAKDYTDAEDAKVEAEVAKKEDKANLKALAYKDSAEGTVEVVTGINDASYTPAGEVTVSLSATSTEIASSGSFTPAGTISAPDITVTPSTAVVKHIVSEGTLPSVAEVKSQFATTGMVAALDETDSELLVISVAAKADALTATGFNAGALPAFGDDMTVVTGISGASASAPVFSGTLGAVEVKGSYDKATSATGTFAGTAATIGHEVTKATKTVTVQ